MRRRNSIPTDAMERIGLGETSSSYGSARWPALAAEARYGLARDMLEVIEPNTEADPVAVLANILIAFGNALALESEFAGPLMQSQSYNSDSQATLLFSRACTERRVCQRSKA